MAEPFTAPKVGQHRPRRREKGKERAESNFGTALANGGPSKRVQQTNADWDCIPVARSEVSSIPLLWSRDGRFYFTAANTSIFVHSCTSPNFTRLSTLSSTDPNGHRKRITSLLLHPTNQLQLITASDDGTVKIWDWVEGRHIRTIKLVDDGGVKQICLAQVDEKWWIFATVTNPKPGKKVKPDGSHLQHRVMRVPLLPPPTPTDNKPVTYLYLVGKLRKEPAAIMVSPRSTYVVALAGAKAYVYRLPKNVADDKWKPDCVKFVSDVSFTCGAFAPDRKSTQEEWFATGDERGVIRLWHGLGEAFRQLDAAAAAAQQTPDKPVFTDTEKRLPTTSLHWHAHAVAGIAFTSGGAQILSVGEESVLVQWHLASGRREYIPRLGGRAILSVAVRPGARGVEEEFWMGFADGAMVRVGATTGSVSTVGQGVRLDPLRPASARHYPISIHPSTKALVVPSSHPSTLQFIDPFESTVLFDLEVAPSNRVSRRAEKEIVPIAVEHVAFSQPRDGKSEWMATIEGRSADEHEGGGFVKTLKFWRWSGDRYIVNTQYPQPHGTDNITTLAFGPLHAEGEPYVLTGSTSGTLKIWQVRQTKRRESGKQSSKSSAELYWAMRSSFSYRSLEVYGAVFSPDATLIAVAHGSVVTLWDTESNVLLRVLEPTISARKLAFAGGEGRYLAAAGTSSGLTVWDLLSCEVIQTLPVTPVDILLPLPTGFVTSHSTANKASISLYTANGTHERTIPIKAGFPVLTTLPSHNTQLVGITSAGEIFRVGHFVSTTAPAARAITTAYTPARRGTSIWQEMFGKDAFLDDLDVAPEVEAATAVSALQRKATGNPPEVFDGPSHTLPPVGMLYDAFMDELLGQQPEVNKSDEANVIEYEAAPTLASAPLSLSAASVRSVTDGDMTQLESFFEGLFVHSPAKAKAHPTQTHTVKSKGRPNGVSNGLSRSVSTPVKPLQNLGTSLDDEPEVVDGKRKSKKRKAPRHSDV